MSFTIKRSNVLLPDMVIADNAINNDLSVSILGKNADDYAPSVGESLLQHLENFAAPISPENNTQVGPLGTITPLTGQLWYNTSTGLLNVYSGTAWYAVSGKLTSVSSSILPNSTNLHDIGSSSKKWQDIYSVNEYTTNLTATSIISTNITNSNKITSDQVFVSTNLKLGSTIVLNASSTQIYSSGTTDTVNIGTASKRFNEGVFKTVRTDNLISDGSAITLRDSLKPSSDSTYSLGDSSKKFTGVYADTLYEGSKTLSQKYVAFNSTNGITLNNNAVLSSKDTANVTRQICKLDSSNRLQIGNNSTPMYLNHSKLYLNGVEFPVPDNDGNLILDTGKSIKITDDNSNLFTVMSMENPSDTDTSLPDVLRIGSVDTVMELSLKSLDINNLTVRTGTYQNKPLHHIMLELVYPVGTVYENNVSSENPKTLMDWNDDAVSWVPFGAGRVVVGSGTGVDINNKSQVFPLVGTNSTGGEYSHVITVDEMPSHSHSITMANGGDGNNRDNQNVDYGNAGRNVKTSTAGGTKSHNNVQPYVVASRWVRVS